MRFFFFFFNKNKIKLFANVSRGGGKVLPGHASVAIPPMIGTAATGFPQGK